MYSKYTDHPRLQILYLLIIVFTRCSNNMRESVSSYFFSREIHGKSLRPVKCLYLKFIQDVYHTTIGFYAVIVISILSNVFHWF
jgi:hypothetical protein